MMFGASFALWRLCDVTLILMRGNQRKERPAFDVKCTPMAYFAEEPIDAMKKELFDELLESNEAGQVFI
jgi:hypothetical protein